jgi:hypothetical protein
MPRRTSETVAVRGPAHVYCRPIRDVNHVPLGLLQQGGDQW